MKHFRSQRWFLVSVFILTLATGCKNDDAGKKETTVIDTPRAKPVNVPVFDADTAYGYVGAQAALGPAPLARRHKLSALYGWPKS